MIPDRGCEYQFGNCLNGVSGSANAQAAYATVAADISQTGHWVGTRGTDFPAILIFVAKATQTSVGVHMRKPKKGTHLPIFFSIRSS
jgi:hypothetical protein